MGVIDDHRKIPAGWHDLHPSLDPAGRGQRIQHPGEGAPQGQGADSRRQSVIHRKLPGDRKTHPADHAVPYQFEAHAARTVTNVFGTVVAVVPPGGKGEVLPGRGRQNLLRCRIVQIDDGAVTGVKKPFFALEIVFHCFVIVEVILCQIGKDPRREVQAVDPLLVQRMGRNLHHHKIASRLFHQRKQGMNLVSVGGGVVGGKGLLSHHILNGSDQSHLVSLRLEHRFEQQTGRGFSIGAGDADDLDFFSGIAKKSGAKPGVNPPAVFHDQLMFCPGVPLGNDHRGAGLFGHPGVLMSVVLGALHADKNHPLFDLAGVVGDPRHFDLTEGAILFVQILKLHVTTSVSTCGVPGHAGLSQERHTACPAGRRFIFVNRYCPDSGTARSPPCRFPPAPLCLRFGHSTARRWRTGKSPTCSH